MKRARLIRVTLALIATLALSSLPLVFLASDDKPTSLNLPPFKQELHLSVTGKWAADDCVDVTVVTNLPEGTFFVVGAQPRARPGTLFPEQPVDQVFAWTQRVLVRVASARIDKPGLFCGLVQARRQGTKRDTEGILLAARVSASSFWGLPFDQTERQADLIGPDGCLLRGPLTTVFPNHDAGRTVVYAESKTFVLEPLPMLPEDEESEQNDETGVDSE